MSPSVIYFCDFFSFFFLSTPIKATISQKLKADVLENKLDFFLVLSSLAVFPFHEIHLGYSICNLTEILIHVPCFVNEKGEEEKDGYDESTRLKASPKPRH